MDSQTKTKRQYKKKKAEEEEIAVPLKEEPLPSSVVEETAKDSNTKVPTKKGRKKKEKEATLLEETPPVETEVPAITEEMKSGKWKYRPRKLRDKNVPIVIKPTLTQYTFYNEEDELDNVILHLKITKKDIEESMHLTGNQYSSFVYTPYISDPIPAEPNILGMHTISSSQFEDKAQYEHQGETPLESLDEIEKRRNNDLSMFKISSSVEDEPVKTTIEEVHDREETVNVILQKEKESVDGGECVFVHDMYEKQDKNTTQYMESVQRRISKKRFIPVLYEYVDNIHSSANKHHSIHCISSKREYPMSTNVACWWCCLPFKEIPCFIPCKYEKEKDLFYLYGNFCSFNCAASYVFSKNREDQWEQYSLLNLLYKKIFKKTNVKIQLAPPKECLTYFGGCMTIEEYRNASLRLDRDYTILYPNLIMLIPRIEEIQYDVLDAKADKKFIPMNDKLIHQIEKDFKLKREIPIVDKNKTLLNFLQNTEHSAAVGKSFVSI
jgi:hypothetical protein